MKKNTETNIAIEVNQLTKTFRYWTERPNTLKTLLARLSSLNFSFGNYSELTILENVSFQIKNGEFVGILGKNGAGKSSLLKLISQIYHPTLGTIKTYGKIAPLIELGAGFHPDLTGMENIFLNAAVLGYGRAETLKKLDSIIAFSEIAEHLHREVKHYSSGMMVRLGFAIAAHLDADIYLIDEVLAVGDYNFQQKCTQKIKSLHQAGKTIILITHGAETVADNCTRSIVISNKKIVHDGDPKFGAELYKKL